MNLVDGFQALLLLLIVIIDVTLVRCAVLLVCVRQRGNWVFNWWLNIVRLVLPSW